MTVPESARNYLSTVVRLLESVDLESMVAIAGIMRRVSEAGGTVFICGNGGSASTASHMACDISKNASPTGRERLRVMSLTDNMAHFSAIANDLDYTEVFVDPLRNLMTSKDALLAISASGNSPNVVKAAQFARDLGVPVIAFTGFKGGVLKELGTAGLHVDCPEYGPVEDLHLVFNHLLVITLREMIGSVAA